MNDDEIGRSVAVIAEWFTPTEPPDPRQLETRREQPHGRNHRFTRAVALAAAVAVTVAGLAIIELLRSDTAPAPATNPPRPTTESTLDESTVPPPPTIATNPAAALSSVPWPDDVDRRSALEELIDVPGSTNGAFNAYQQRADRLLRRCMADGGHRYTPGEPLGDPEAAVRLDGNVTIDGTNYAGGCRSWAQDLAYPGNHFGAIYAELDAAALRHPDYVAGIAAYDQCLIAAGYSTLPDVTGLSDQQAEATFDDYTHAALTCEQTAALQDTKRALEIYIGDALVATQPDAVETYVDLLRQNAELR